MKFTCCGGGDFLRRNNLLIIDLDGAMIIPHYTHVPRAACRMLTLAWERRWEELVQRCELKPDEAFAKTEHSGRTALHLATFNDGCPLEVAAAMLKANRHAILVEDRNFYTPLHNLGLFHGGDELMSLFCDTAIMVEQELQGRGKLPTPSRTSPLYLAAKRDAPTSTLRLLLNTRARSRWIAPFTGAESYWDPEQALDKFSSPLEILLRGRSACFVGLSQETKQQMADMARNLGNVTDNQIKNTPPKANDTHDQNALVIWEKCLLLLRENIRTITTIFQATSDSMEEEKTVPSLVHTVASLKVPMPLLLQLAMELFPEQAVQRDDTGNYPLVHILNSNHPYATKQLITIILRPNSQQQPSTSHSGLATRSKSSTSSSSSSSCYPLSYIQECLRVALATTGLTWEGGMKDIVMANSDVLSMPDSQTKLVPAFLAAAQKDVTLDTVFYLLHAEPQVVTLGIR